MKKTERARLINELKSLKIVNENEVLYSDYVDYMIEFQTILSKIVFDGDDSARMDDIIYKIKEMSREKGLSRDYQVSNTIKGLQSIAKELAISFSGKKGEERIVNKISTCRREDLSTFSNVTVSDDVEETEIDNVILTKKGIIILEIKNTKCPITISEDGRLLYNNEASYHNVSMGTKMSKKRRLLRFCLESKLRELGSDIPVSLDSYIVFSTPGTKQIKITDNYGKEKFCSKVKLPFIIDKFHTQETYSDEEYETLYNCLSNMQINSKKFSVNINFKNVCDDFLKTMESLEQNETDVLKEIKITHTPNIKHLWNREYTATALSALAIVGGFVITTLSLKWFD